MHRVGLVFVLATLVAACSAASPTAPSAASPLTGTWTGTVVRGSVSATLRLDLDSAGAAAPAVASGRFELGDPAGVISGTVIGGLVNSTLVTLTLVPATPPVCPGTLQAGQVSLQVTLANGRMSGDAIYTRCGGLETATVTLTRS